MTFLVWDERECAAQDYIKLIAFLKYIGMQFSFAFFIGSIPKAEVALLTKHIAFPRNFVSSV